jgi:hypothetical protein
MVYWQRLVHPAPLINPQEEFQKNLIRAPKKAQPFFKAGQG